MGIKTLCQKNEKIHHRLGENICKTYPMIKDYYPKIYKELLKVNNKMNHPNTKWTKHPSRHLTKDIDGK